MPTLDEATPTPLKKSAVQMAADGEWEAAVNLHDLAPGELGQWLASADSDIALEVLFETPSGVLDGFVGVRHLEPDPGQRVRVWGDIMADAAALQNCEAAEYAAGWAARLGFTNPITNRPPQRWEIGVFNQWRSAGPEVLGASGGDADGSLQRPTWAQDGATAPICLEQVWLEPFHLWIAHVVSYPHEDRHFIDAATLAERARNAPDSVKDALRRLAK